MSDYEVRTVPVEVRSIEGEDGRRRIEGRAIVYNAWSDDLGGFREKLSPGSAKLEGDLLALFDHDTSMVLGRTTAGTLEARDDGAGIVMTAFPPETTWARDLLVSMDRGDIRHMSFRLRVNDDAWGIGEDGMPERTIRDMDVSELSVVSMPAYPQTSAEARSKAAELLPHAEAVPSSVDEVRETEPEPTEPATEGGAPEAASDSGTTGSVNPRLRLIAARKFSDDLPKGGHDDA